MFLVRKQISFHVLLLHSHTIIFKDQFIIIFFAKHYSSFSKSKEVMILIKSTMKSFNDSAKDAKSFSMR